MGILARLYGARGEYESAMQMHRQRLDLALAAQAPDPAEIADAHIRIGRTLLSISQAQEAESHFLAAVEAADADGLAREHVDALRSVADTQRLLGKLEDSESNARLTVELTDEVRGETTAAAAFARGTLASTLAKLRRFDEAEIYFHEAIDLLSRTLGPEHGNTLSTRSNLARMLLDSGDPAGAAEQAGLAVQIGERTLGPSHPAVGRYLQNYSKALELLGRTDEAIEGFERTAEVFRKTLPESDYKRATPLLSLAGIYLAQSRSIDAEAAAREALGILTGALPEGHVITAVADCRMGRALIAQSRTDEAQSYFERSTGPLLDTDSFPQYREECLAAAAEFHRSTGRVNEAARLETALQGEIFHFDGHRYGFRFARSQSHLVEGAQELDRSFHRRAFESNIELHDLFSGYVSGVGNVHRHLHLLVKTDRRRHHDQIAVVVGRVAQSESEGKCRLMPLVIDPCVAMEGADLGSVCELVEER
jgi:tetratricopeptide (TPR) repeat protein